MQQSNNADLKVKPKISITLKDKKDNIIKEDSIIQKQSPKVLHKKKMFLKLLQNSQENTCCGVSFFIKLQARDPKLYQKRNSNAVVLL